MSGGALLWEFISKHQMFFFFVGGVLLSELYSDWVPDFVCNSVSISVTENINTITVILKCSIVGLLNL